MIALVASVLLASLLGSLHCAGMCGAFVAFAVGVDSRDRATRWSLQTAYHGGRLITYTMLGVLAGGLGHAVDMGASAVGLQHLAMTIAACTMIVVGAAAFAREFGFRAPRLRFPRQFMGAYKRAHAAAIGLNPTGRAFTIGLLTTLLPCGWLYAFALVAAGTASPLWGGLTMAAFWVGTVPLLACIGAGVQAVSGPLGRFVPGAMSLLIVLVGVYTLVGRAQVELPASRAEAARVEPDAAALIRRVHLIDHCALPARHEEACGGNDLD